MISATRWTNNSNDVGRLVERNWAEQYLFLFVWIKRKQGEKRAIWLDLKLCHAPLVISNSLWFIDEPNLEFHSNYYPKIRRRKMIEFGTSVKCCLMKLCLIFSVYYCKQHTSHMVQVWSLPYRNFLNCCVPCTCGAIQSMNLTQLTTVIVFNAFFDA